MHNHIEGHIHVDCEESSYGTQYSMCECCNGFLDSVKNHVYELQQSAREAGLCPGCGGEWCSGGCDDE
jgi:hypothetical protein